MSQNLAAEKSFLSVIADLVFGRPAYLQSGLTAEQYVAACGWDPQHGDVVDAVNLLGIGDKSIDTGGNVLSQVVGLGAVQGAPGMAAMPGMPAGPSGPGGGAPSGGAGGYASRPVVQETINHYTTYITTEDNDTVVDSSVNTVIQAGFGSNVDVDIDNNTATASGDGAVAANGNANGVATGAGAVAAGRDISDSSVNTGEFTGTQVGDFEGDNLVSTVGDGNISAGDDIEDTNIAQHGSDITSINDSDNVAFGHGSTVDDSINQEQNINQEQLLIDQEIEQDNDLIDIDVDPFLRPGFVNELPRAELASELAPQHEVHEGAEAAMDDDMVDD